MSTHHKVPIIGVLATSRSAVNVERVLHLTSRVVDVEVQGVEVKPFVFNFGAFSDSPAHGCKHIFDLFNQSLDRVTRTRHRAMPTGSHIDGFFAKNTCLVLSFKHLLTDGESLRNLAASTTEILTCSATICGFEGTDDAVGCDQRGVVAKDRLLCGLEFFE